MSRKRDSGSAPCRVDHNGRYKQIPDDIVDAILPIVSSRAICALLVLLRRMNGFNNGKVALSSRDLGAALGNQNYAANSAALRELQQAGLIELKATYPKGKRMAREYRLTFAHSIEQPATHEWKEAIAHLAACKMETRKQKRPPETSTETWKPVEASAARGKRSVEAITTDGTETSGLAGFLPVEDSSAHISNHTQSAKVVRFPNLEIPRKTPAGQNDSAWMSLDDLRAFASGYILWRGTGSQSSLAKRSGIPGGTLSKFLNSGRGLPDAHRRSLQTTIGALWPLKARTGEQQ